MDLSFNYCSQETAIPKKLSTNPGKIKPKTRMSSTNFRATGAGNNGHPAEDILSDVRRSVHKLECPIKRKPCGAGWRTQLSCPRKQEMSDDVSWIAR